ncbi:hypothetical protein GQR58_024417 [Nymphon striatum]|nr:hypothetical protein GQR58_024417 [Nymphon striatum]
MESLSGSMSSAVLMYGHSICVCGSCQILNNLGSSSISILSTRSSLRDSIGSLVPCDQTSFLSDGQKESWATSSILYMEVKEESIDIRKWEQLAKDRGSWRTAVREGCRLSEERMLAHARDLRQQRKDKTTATLLSPTAAYMCTSNGFLDIIAKELNNIQLLDLDGRPLLSSGPVRAAAAATDDDDDCQ